MNLVVSHVTYYLSISRIHHEKHFVRQGKLQLLSMDIKIHRFLNILQIPLRAIVSEYYRENLP